MWNAILSAAGWTFFYALLISWVWSSIVEQGFFAQEDPETWDSPLTADESPADHRYHAPAWGVPTLAGERTV